MVQAQAINFDGFRAFLVLNAAACLISLSVGAPTPLCILGRVAGSTRTQALPCWWGSSYPPGGSGDLWPQGQVAGLAGPKLRGIKPMNLHVW